MILYGVSLIYCVIEGLSDERDDTYDPMISFRPIAVVLALRLFFFVTLENGGGFSVDLLITKFYAVAMLLTVVWPILSHLRHCISSDSSLQKNSGLSER